MQPSFNVPTTAAVVGKQRPIPCLPCEQDFPPTPRAVVLKRVTRLFQKLHLLVLMMSQSGALWLLMILSSMCPIHFVPFVMLTHTRTHMIACALVTFCKQIVLQVLFPCFVIY